MIDLDNFTEGTDYVKINIPEGFSKSAFPGAIVTPMGGGKSHDKRSEKRFYMALANGVSTSIINYNLVDKFVMSARHTSGASAVFVRYYLIVYLGTNSHFEFTDANDTRKSYCRGIIQNATGKWFARDPANVRVRINWESVW